MVDSGSKYVYNFDIYCSQNLEGQDRVGGGIWESIVAHGVVTKLCTRLEYLGHCVAVDNYFSSIPLFVELALKGIYATRTMRAIELDFFPI